MNPRIEEIIPQTRDEWIGEIKKTLRRWDGIKKYHPQKWEELNIHKIVIDDIAFLLAEVERLEREKLFKKRFVEREGKVMEMWSPKEDETYYYPYIIYPNP